MTRHESARDILSTTLGELLAHLTAPSAPEATWIDIRDPDCPVPYRAALAAGQRGELAVHRVGRRGLVRRSDLDAWIARQPTLAEPVASPTVQPTAAETILRREGWRKAG